MTIPAVTTYAAILQRFSGDVPTMGPQHNGVITDLIADVTAEIVHEIRRERAQPNEWGFLSDGTTTTARRYTARPNSPLLLIDDATTVTAVALYVRGVLSRTLILHTDYEVYPLQGTPIIGLTYIGDWWWPSNVAGCVVTQDLGYTTTTIGWPLDIVRAVERETIREFLSLRAGENDAIGMTPFGHVVTSKAFTDITWHVIHSYRLGGASLR